MKGNIEDVYTISFIILLLGILGVMGYLFSDKVFTAMENTNLGPGTVNFTTAAPNIHAQSNNNFQFMDGCIAFALVLLIGGAFALAFYSRSHPYLAVISVFIQIFFVIGGYFCKLFWQGFSTATPDLQAIALNNFPITNAIMTYLPFIAFITLIGIIVLYFTKPQAEYAGGY